MGGHPHHPCHQLPSPGTPQGPSAHTWLRYKRDKWIWARTVPLSPKPPLPLSPPCCSPAPRPEVVGRAGETPPQKSREGFGAPCVLQEWDSWYCILGEPAWIEGGEAAGPPGGGPGPSGGLAHRVGGLAAGLVEDMGTVCPCTLDGCVEGWQLRGHGGGRSHCSRCQLGADGWALLEST